ncbi:MAG TPA: hypothetical protein P5274_01215 [Candidatus Paceibacterota bacterium]|nr:hypothetical protein [Candidatus Paceibacterota bacterium]
MFKWFKKFNLSNPATFWRYVVIAFGVGLVIVFVGQTIFLFIMSEVVSDQSASSLIDSSDGGLDPKLVTKLVGEINSRPLRLADILATTTPFVDPSL